MALAAATVWEVRTTGAATNGGGFVAGASGTDFSQQDAPQVAVADAVAIGTTTITSATAAFATTHVGNIIYMQGGTGSLAAGWYQVVTRSSSTTITVDRNVAAGTGITLNLGGALSTPALAGAVMVASNRCFIKAGTYQHNATLTISANATPGNTQATDATRFIGYNTTRGDITIANGLTRPIIQLITNTGLTAFNCTGNGVFLQNLDIDGNSLGTSTGAALGSFGMAYNCKVRNCTTRGINAAPASGFCATVDCCEITGCSGTSAVSLGQGCRLLRSHIHDNTIHGVVITTTLSVVLNNLIVNNTGASTDGINTIHSALIWGNTIYGNGRHGINNNQAIWVNCDWHNNLLASNGSTGITGATGSSPPDFFWDGNGYYDDTKGNMAAANLQYGVGPYVMTDVTATGNPFTDSGGGDFTLNNTAGEGASLRGAAVPGNLPGIAQTGAMDFGALQAEADAAAGGGTGSVFSSPIIRAV